MYVWLFDNNFFYIVEIIQAAMFRMQILINIKLWMVI